MKRREILLTLGDSNSVKSFELDYCCFTDCASYKLYIPLVGLVNAEGSAGTKSFSSGDSIMDG